MVTALTWTEVIEDGSQVGWELHGPNNLYRILMEYEQTPAEVTGLPSNYKELDWYVAKQTPNLLGCDVFVAVDEQAEKSYCVCEMDCGDWYVYDERLPLNDMLMKVAMGHED